MQHRALGTTGITVSEAGLGTGGANVFGQRRGADVEEARRLVRRALDLGVDLFDTAPIYGVSETRLGEALVGVPRSEYRIATKYTYRHPDGTLLDPAEVERSIHDSLARLRVDDVDVLQVHALLAEHYDAVMASQLPVLARAREAGLIRAIGVTESFGGNDPLHETLVRAVDDGVVDVVMVGYNVLNQNAERHVLTVAAAKGIGVIVMAAVRNVLGSREATEAVVADLKRTGALADAALPDRDPLGWLVHDGTPSVPAACYRFAASNPAVSSVLTGTFDIGHLEENVAAIELGPFPAADGDRLRAAFGHLELGLGK